MICFSVTVLLLNWKVLAEMGDHQHWPYVMAETQPHNRSSFAGFLFFQRVWRETRLELICLDISLLTHPSVLCLMKRLPESSQFTVEQHWRWYDEIHHLFHSCSESNSSYRIRVYIIENSMFFTQRQEQKWFKTCLCILLYRYFLPVKVSI